MTDQNGQIHNVFHRNSPGSLFKDKHNQYWIKPEQKVDLHLDGMLVNLFTGEIKHYSWCVELTPIYGSEITW